MRALVAYGSKMGGATGLAQMVGRALEEHRFVVERWVADIAATRQPGEQQPWP